MRNDPTALPRQGDDPCMFLVPSGRPGRAPILAFPVDHEGGGPVSPPLSSDDISRLRRLRTLAIESRLFPHQEFWNGCARVFGQATPCPRSVAALVLRSSSVAFHKRLEFYRPGAIAISDDERWLLRLLEAIEFQDHGNVRALTAFRLRPQFRRAFPALVTKLARTAFRLPSPVTGPKSLEQ